MPGTGTPPAVTATAVITTLSPTIPVSVFGKTTSCATARATTTVACALAALTRAVNAVVPSATACTAPVESTVATDGLSIVHSTPRGVCTGRSKEVAVSVKRVVATANESLTKIVSTAGVSWSLSAGGALISVTESLEHETTAVNSAAEASREVIRRIRGVWRG